MNTFNDLQALKEARLSTGSLVQILNPTTIPGVITGDPLGAIQIASGNYFLPRLDDLETLSARKSMILDEGQIIQGYQKDDNGVWTVGNFLTPTINYGGQIWWPTGVLPGDKTSRRFRIKGSAEWTIVDDILSIGAFEETAGNANVILTYERNDSLKYAPTEDSGGGGTAIFQVVTTADSPVAGQDNAGYLCNTSAGPMVINLPASPDANDYVAIGDYNGHLGTNSVTVSTTDGSPIMGLAEDFEINTNYSVYGFSYIDPVVGWKATTAIGESEAPQAIQDKTRFTNVIGQTTFSVPQYDVGFIDVYYNGVRLDAQQEFIATDRATVRLNSPVGDNTDVIEIVSYNHIALTNEWDRPVGDNLLINGDFSVSQRLGEAGAPVTNGYTTDRWIITNGTGLTHSIFRGNVPTYEVGINTASLYTGTTAAPWYLEQRVEMDATFMNGDLTYSFWLYSDDPGVNSGDLTLWIRLFYGVDSTAVELPVEVIPVTNVTGWVKYQFTTAVPARDGTKAQHEGDFLAAIIGLPQKTGSSLGTGFANAKLERGPRATRFISDSPAENLAKCQRYYLATWSVRSRIESAVGEVYTPAYFPTAMRRVPTVVPKVDVGSGVTISPVIESTGGFSNKFVFSGGSFDIQHSYTADAEL